MEIRREVTLRRRQDSISRITRSEYNHVQNDSLFIAFQLRWLMLPQRTSSPPKNMKCCCGRWICVAYHMLYLPLRRTISWHNCQLYKKNSLISSGVFPPLSSKARFFSVSGCYFAVYLRTASQASGLSYWLKWWFVYNSFCIHTDFTSTESSNKWLRPYLLTAPMTCNYFSRSVNAWIPSLSCRQKNSRCKTLLYAQSSYRNFFDCTTGSNGYLSRIQSMQSIVPTVGIQKPC